MKDAERAKAVDIPEREEALELPDREAMTLLSTAPAMPDPTAGYTALPADTTQGAQDTAAGTTADASELAQADASASEQGGTTSEDRRDTFTSSDSASAQS